MRKNIKNITNHIPLRHTQRIIDRFKVIKIGQSLSDVPPKHMQRKRGEANKISGKIFLSLCSYKLSLIIFNKLFKIKFLTIFKLGAKPFLLAELFKLTLLTVLCPWIIKINIKLFG